MKLKAAAELFYTSMVTVKADTTIKWYRKRLDPFVVLYQDREVDSLDLFDLEEFRKTLGRDSKAPGRQGKISVYTVHGYIRALKHFFRWLRDRKIIREDPSVDLEKPRLPKQPRKGVTPENADRMITAAKLDPRDYAILMFTQDTGCRAGGIYNLLTDNLDLIHNKAIIREKGEKERTVFFTSRTALALIMYLSVRQNPNGEEHFFLSSTTHKPLTYDGVYQIYRRLAKQCKIKSKFSPHQWRHAAIRSWLMAGMNLKTASEIAGHTTEKVTGDIYGTLNEQELQAIYNDITSRLHQ